MIRGFDTEVEMEFDNGSTSGYINIESNHETMAVVAMSVGVGSEEGSYQDAVVDKKDLVKFLKKTLEMLEK